MNILVHFSFAIQSVHHLESLNGCKKHLHNTQLFCDLKGADGNLAEVHHLKEFEPVVMGSKQNYNTSVNTGENLQNEQTSSWMAVNFMNSIWSDSC